RRCNTRISCPRSSPSTKACCGRVLLANRVRVAGAVCVWSAACGCRDTSTPADPSATWTFSPLWRITPRTRGPRYHEGEKHHVTGARRAYRGRPLTRPAVLLDQTGALRAASTAADTGTPETQARRQRFLVSVVESAATKASWGTSTRPIVFIRFLP